METKQITTEQIEKAKELVGDFRKDKEKYVYCGIMLNSDYCHLLGIDYSTLHLLGEVSYSLVYVETEDKDYQLYCETYIDNVMNDKLSFILEDIAKDSEDYLGLFTEKAEGEDKEIGVAQWLPSNWKELMSDEQKREIAEEWCKENSEELVDYLDENDKENIAYDYIDNNPNEVADSAFSKLSDPKDFIKECIDNL
jgi:hypothetical protein